MYEISHQAHHLLTRETLQLWCGGTMPPTEVEVKHKEGELNVAIFPEDHPIDTGTIAKPDEIVPFLLPEGFDANPDSIQEFAVNALTAHTK